MIEIRVFEAFAGYGSQLMALKRLEKNYPDKIKIISVGIAEIDKYAIQAYKAVHGDVTNYGDISKINWDEVPDFDLFTYSFPCTDISIAGVQKGFEENSGTRSSLLWECRKAILAKKPKYLLLENVKALVQKKNIASFNKWITELESYGYTNFTKVLNAKDYGVPQNRERVFVVSIRELENYEYPEPFELDKCMKDCLEKDVNIKYFLSQNAVQGRKTHCEKKAKEGCGFKSEPTTGEDVAKSITTKEGSRHTDNYIIEPLNPYDDGTCRTIKAQYAKTGMANFKRKDSMGATGVIINPLKGISGKGWHYEQNVYDPNGISRAIKAGGGSGNIPKIIQIGNIYPDKPNFRNRTSGRIYDKRGLSPRINTCQGGGHEPKILDKSNIRKLTPRECFRLMGVSEENIDKIQAAGISNSQQYKLAGNSIVVDVLYHIFKKMFVDKENESAELTLF